MVASKQNSFVTWTMVSFLDSSGPRCYGSSEEGTESYVAKTRSQDIFSPGTLIFFLSLENRNNSLPFSVLRLRSTFVIVLEHIRAFFVGG